jgi:hypothetical protein
MPRVLGDLTVVGCTATDMRFDYLRPRDGQTHMAFEGIGKNFKGCVRKQRAEPQMRSISTRLDL